MPYAINDSFKPFDHIAVPEAHNFETVPRQLLRALTICFHICLGPMLTAIKFNNELRIVTGKVGDKLSDWNLPLEVTPF